MRQRPRCRCGGSLLRWDIRGLRICAAGRGVNPAEVLLHALNEDELESRASEGLPWLALKYPEMDWDWLVDGVKLRDRQN